MLPTPNIKASINWTAFTLFIVHVSNPLGFLLGYHYSVARSVAKFGCPSPTAEEYSGPASSTVWWYRSIGLSLGWKKTIQHYITISYAQMHITSLNSGMISILMSLHSKCLGWLAFRHRFLIMLILCIVLQYHAHKVSVVKYSRYVCICLSGIYSKQLYIF